MRVLRFWLACACLAFVRLACATEPDADDDYVFDASMLRGMGGNSAALDRFNRRQSILPGTYDLDVWLNQRFAERLAIRFDDDEAGRTRPCFTAEQFDRLNILFTADPEEQLENVCMNLAERVPGARADARMDVLRLDLQVPQALIRQVPRGYVRPEDLDAGVTAGFVNYMGNYYQTWQTQGTRQWSGYLSLHSGVNLGLWQLRHQANVNWGASASRHWQNLRTHVQRPLWDWGSQLTLGQAYTSGRFFSGLNYVGASLARDERMLPDSQRGYAPVVRGVANSNARVSIKQNGQEIYQTTVAPGPFVIADLYPNSGSGDLDVEVLEASGAVERFSVPFSAAPESLRPGQWHYEAVVGRSHQTGADSLFGDLVYQYGINNALTAYGGTRLASGYRALVAGGVLASRWGALGADITWSRARQSAHAAISQGWMLRVAWNHTVAATGTGMAVSYQRYSTAGYQDLGSVLRQRASRDSDTGWVGERERSRFDLRMHQTLGRFGQVFASGSVQDYHASSTRAVQYQFGYGTVLAHGVGVNLTLMRQHRSARAGAEAQRDTTVMVSLSIPLGRSAGSPSLNTTWSSDADAQTQLGMSGTLDEDHTLSYSLGAAHARSARQPSVNGSVHKRFSVLSAGISAAHNGTSRQLSSNVQGALALHAGGLTLGPYVSDTFALVHAPGAKGAKVFNSQARIDGSGYALVPSLTPYRYTGVALDPAGMPTSIELLDGEKRTAPYAGAVVKLQFATRRGQALLIRAVQTTGTPVPFGAEVLDSAGASVGVVGQGGRVYVRTEHHAGSLAVRWGTADSDVCLLPYRFDEADFGAQALLRLDGVCRTLDWAVVP